MKFKFLLLTILGIQILTTTLHAQMVAANDRVTVEVRTDLNSDRKEIGKTGVATKAQNVTLTILVQGKAKTPETRVIKWIAWGRDLKSREKEELDSDEIKLELGAQGSQTVVTKSVTTTSTPEYSTASKGGKVKSVDARGILYLGYSVQVVDGGKVVGETSNPRGIGDEGKK